MVDQVSRPATVEGRGSISCSHYWIIEVQIGPVSRGICQLCEDVREFKNYIEEKPSDEDELLVHPGDWDSYAPTVQSLLV